MGCWQIFAKRVKGLFLAPGQTPMDPVILGIISLANVSIVSLIYSLQHKLIQKTMKNEIVLVIKLPFHCKNMKLKLIEGDQQLSKELYMHALIQLIVYH